MPETGEDSIVLGSDDPVGSYAARCGSLTAAVTVLNDCQIECEERDFQTEAEADEAFERLYAAWAKVREMFGLRVPASAE